MQKMWIVRSVGGELIPLFKDNGIVSISWCTNTDFSSCKDKSCIKQKLEECYPDSSKSIPAWNGFLDNFLNVMKQGDYVLTYDSSLRTYYLGEIQGDYSYRPDLSKEFPHTRKVGWIEKTISRDLISNSTKNSLGSPQTLFRITNEQKDEVLKLFKKEDGTKITEESIEIENKEFSQTLIENARESLKDAINQLSPDDMEELVKEVLNAMGYIARRSKKGADRGVDVFASKDGLGLEDPRIFVEVKHRTGQMHSEDIRKFMGGRQSSDKCLYVSTGGFTKDAKYEAERSSIPLTLIDIDELASIISLHYDNFSAEGKSLLPLKKVYIPV